MLHKTLEHVRLNELWGAARDGQGAIGRPCPVCQSSMASVLLSPRHLPRLDVCRRCNLVWFDAGEYETFPVEPARPGPALPPQARQILAIEQVKLMAEPRERERDSGPPEETWKFVASIFGMPVEEDDEPLLQRPSR